MVFYLYIIILSISGVAEERWEQSRNAVAQREGSDRFSSKTMKGGAAISFLNGPSATNLQLQNCHALNVLPFNNPKLSHFYWESERVGKISLKPALT